MFNFSIRKLVLSDILYKTYKRYINKNFLSNSNTLRKQKISIKKD